MSDGKPLSIIEYYDRTKWVIVVCYRLYKKRYTGPVIFNFHRGDVSRKAHAYREIIEEKME
jgi:hypothetical protein